MQYGSSSAKSSDSGYRRPTQKRQRFARCGFGKCICQSITAIVRVRAGGVLGIVAAVAAPCERTRVARVTSPTAPWRSPLQLRPCDPPGIIPRRSWYYTANVGTVRPGRTGNRWGCRDNGMQERCMGMHGERGWGRDSCCRNCYGPRVTGERLAYRVEQTGQASQRCTGSGRPLRWSQSSSARMLPVARAMQVSAPP